MGARGWCDIGGGGEGECLVPTDDEPEASLFSDDAALWLPLLLMESLSALALASLIAALFSLLLSALLSFLLS